MLQNVAECCSVLQYIYMIHTESILSSRQPSYSCECESRCQMIWHIRNSVAVCCSVLQCVAVCCSVLQCVAVRVAAWCSVLQSTVAVVKRFDICIIALQCIAVCCSRRLLQTALLCVAVRVAVCWSVLQCTIAVFKYFDTVIIDISCDTYSI